MSDKPAATPRTDKFYDMVSDREASDGSTPSKWSYEAILDFLDYSKGLERELASAEAEHHRVWNEWQAEISNLNDELAAAEQRAEQARREALEEWRPWIEGAIAHLERRHHVTDEERGAYAMQLRNALAAVPQADKTGVSDVLPEGLEAVH